MHMQLLLRHREDREIHNRLPQSCLHTTPTRPQDMHSSDNRALRTRRLNHRVRAQAQLILVYQPLGIVLRRRLKVRFERPHARVEPARKLKLAVEHIDGDDLGRTKQPRHRATQQPNRARPKDHDTLCLRRPHVHHPDGMCGDGEWLRQDPLLQRHTWRQLVAEVGVDLEVLGQRARRVGRAGGEFHRRAQVVQSFLAARAAPAGLARFDGHVVARRDVRHRRADRMDGSRCLVAHYQGMRGRDVLVVHAALCPEVDLCRQRVRFGQEVGDGGLGNRELRERQERTIDGGGRGGSN